MNKIERHGNETELRALDKVREAHGAALNAGDASGWAAQFAEDGVQMPPNSPPNIGNAAIGSWTHSFLSQFRVQFALAVHEVRVLGEWAFERGDYTISINPRAGGPAMQDNGKYITVYERKPADGWRMARDIWNSSNPPATM